MGEISQKGSEVSQRTAGQALGPHGQTSEDISSLEREVSSRTKNWCYVLLVIILDGRWEEQKEVSFSRLNFPSYSFNFYLWPGLAIHVFPFLLLSSWEDLSHSSSQGLSASVRQCHSEKCAKQWNAKVPLGVTRRFVCSVHSASREYSAFNSLWLSSLLRFCLLSLT